MFILFSFPQKDSSLMPYQKLIKKSTLSSAIEHTMVMIRVIVLLMAWVNWLMDKRARIIIVLMLMVLEEVSNKHAFIVMSLVNEAHNEAIKEFLSSP